MIEWFKARIRGTTERSIALVAHWLANVTWLIESKFLALAQRAYGQNEVVHACLRLLSQSVPEPPLVPYAENPDGERERLPRDHPLALLIRKPNELMTEYEFWELTTLHMAIVGRSAWFKERNNLGEIVAHWPMRPDRVGPIYSASDEPGERVLSGYSYQVPGQGNFLTIPRRDVIAFNFPDPAGESGGIVEGLGPVSVLARQVAADNEATKFVGALLANYAMPSVILRTKQPVRNDAHFEVIKARFRAEFGGSNRGTPAVVDGDTEISEVGFNLRELEFPQLRKVSESRIAADCGVPAVLVGLQTGLEAATYNNVAGMRRFFAETTLANYWKRFQDQYQNDVATEFGEGIVVEFDKSQVVALADYRKEAIEIMAEGCKAGAVTRNEYRLALGLPEVDGGDVFLVPATTLEIAAGMTSAKFWAIKNYDPTALEELAEYEPSGDKGGNGKAKIRT